jgi:CO/xanthine dehydrogenase Mo-binding subunit
VVHSASGRHLGFGELAADAAKEPVPSIEGLKLKDPKSFRYLGKGQIGIVDLRDITIGAAQYGADTRLPGMKYAVIARPPVTGGKLVSFDDKEALKVSGVEKVMEVQGWPWPSKFQPLGGVAVIARNTGAAIKGRDALKIVWEDGPNGKYDSVAYRAQLEEAARKPGLVVRKEGDVDAALKSADKVITGEYYVPHLAHVSMEAPVAVADVKGDKAEIWAPVQSPGGTRRTSPRRLASRRRNVTVNMTLLGGGFGRKSKCDYAIEAAPALEGDRRAGEGAMDARRRRSQRLPAYRLGRAHRSRSRQDRQGDRLAAPQRRTKHRLDVRSGYRAPGTFRARNGPCRHAVRDRQCAMRIRKRPRTRGSAGSVRCRISRALSRCSPWSASSPMPPTATRRICCCS